MGYIKVDFLGEEYRISETIHEFLEYQKLLPEILNQSLEIIMKNFKRDINGDYDSYVTHATDDIQEYHAFVKRVANDMVVKLSDKGIYDVTAEDVLEQTDALYEIEENAAACLKKATIERTAYLEAKKSGTAYFEQCKYRETVDLRKGLFTTHFSPLLIYSPEKRRRLLEQAHKADQEYLELTGEKICGVRDKYKGICGYIAFYMYYPAYVKIFTEFARKIVSVFLELLASHNKFDYEMIEQYDMPVVSFKMLYVDRASDKAAFLREYFVKCPFCREIYEACLDYGLMDAGTYETAKYFGLTDGLEPKIIKQCEGALYDEDNIERWLEIYILSKGCNKTEAIQDVYEKEIQKIKKDFDEIRGVLDNQKIAAWIKEHFYDKAISFSAASSKELTEKIEKQIENILNRQQYERFVKIGLAGMLGIPFYVEGKEWKQLLSGITNGILANVLLYQQRLKAHMQNCSATCSAMEREYSIAKQKYNEKRILMEQELAALEEDYKKAGPFALPKKNELASEIEKKKMQIEEHRRNREPEALKNGLDRKKREMEEYI